MRADGRRANEMRQCRIEPYPLEYPQGSALIECGKTRVLCAASVQESVPRFLEGTGRGWLTAEYSMLPGSTHTRTPRESHSGRIQGRTQEIQRLIGRSLRAAVRLDHLGPVTITVDCDVLQADGGTRTASITGGYVAVAMAVGKLFPDERDKLLSPIVAVSAGIVQGVPMLDLDYSEDSSADTDVNVVGDGGGKYVEVQGTAERGSFDRVLLDAVLDLAEAGLRELRALQEGCLTTAR